MSIKIQTFREIDDATIYWLGGFVSKTREKPWLRIYVLNHGYVWYHFVPMGMLPWMFVGAKYEFGRLKGAAGSRTFHLRLSDMSEMQFVPFSDIPVDLRQHRKNPELIKEYVCKYVIEGKTFYISQMEIIRSFLVMNSAMANFLLSPSGMDELCRVVSADDVYAEIAFSSRFPRGSLNNVTASYIATLLLDQNFCDFRHSVYECFKTNDQKHFFKPSDLKNMTLFCNGIWSGNDYLVQKISSVRNIKVPFENLKYSHPNDSANDLSEAGNNKRIIHLPQRDKSDYEITDSGYSKSESNPLTVGNEMTKVSFGFEKKVNCKRKEKDADQKYKAIVKIDKNKLSDNNLLSTGTGVKDGKIKPLEIDNSFLYETYKKDIRGLEDFLRAVEYLKTMIPVNHVHIGSLFGDKKFVMLDENVRRSYAIVYLQNAFIIEIARPDYHSIATLILKNISEKQFNYYLRPLLTSMIDNGGHWAQEFLDIKANLNYHLLRHIQKNFPLKIARRIVMYFDVLVI